MTKTDINKQNFKIALQVLTEQFEVTHFEDENGGRKGFFVKNATGESVMGQIDRQSFVGIWGEDELEDKINSAIEEKIKEKGYAK